MKLREINSVQRMAQSSTGPGCGRFRAWLGLALLIALPFALASWCALEFPAQTRLIGDMLASALGGDGRYWSRAQWRADATTLDSARRWMFDIEIPETTQAETSAPVTPLQTNSNPIAPTV